MPVRCGFGWLLTKLEDILAGVVWVFGVVGAVCLEVVGFDLFVVFAAGIGALVIEWCK